MYVAFGIGFHDIDCHCIQCLVLCMCVSLRPHSLLSLAHGYLAEIKSNFSSIFLRVIDLVFFGYCYRRY
jgi:hypothetical protein